ncbi:MAG: 3-dehydroquinate synthase [Alphaproteobacteria bacterium]|nr:3-dehydroquinate synthase [Alphaproteobacteria bacterium]
MTPSSAIADQAHALPEKIVTVDLACSNAPTSYDIVIGDNVLADAATHIQERLGLRRCVLVADSNTAALYQARLEAVLSSGGHTVLKTIVIKAGEAQKSFAQLEALLNELFGLGIDRKTLLIALGGGVVGDLAGLVASLALRGLDFVQIPTTLLAQVDSSVGGKTGIDTALGKNTVGTFYQPRLVLSDVTMLDSLPQREMLAGYAEIVKYGLIRDKAFFDWCVAHGAQLLGGDHDAQAHAVSACCAAKAHIVAEDEKENGIRALLNLGHTFGHALEAVHGFGGTLTHGEGVAIGTIMAFMLAVELGLCPARDEERVRAHFNDIGLMTKPPPFTYDKELLLGLMATDKKAECGQIALVLPHGIGEARVHKGIDVHKIRALWDNVLP